MNLSNTSQYAIRALSYMAYKGNSIYSASELIKNLKISDKYLKRILTTLSNHNIIESIQGRYGGFRLNKEIYEISLYDIVSAVEDIEKYYGCILGFETCSDENPCSLHLKWVPVRDKLLTFLKNTSLSDVLKNPKIMKF